MKRLEWNGGNWLMPGWLKGEIVQGPALAGERYSRSRQYAETSDVELRSLQEMIASKQRHPKLEEMPLGEKPSLVANAADKYKLKTSLQVMTWISVSQFGRYQTGVVDIHNLRVKLLIRYRQLFSQKSKRLIAVRTAYRRTLPGTDGCWGKACETTNNAAVTM